MTTLELDDKLIQTFKDTPGLIIEDSSTRQHFVLLEVKPEALVTHRTFQCIDTGERFVTAASKRHVYFGNCIISQEPMTKEARVNYDIMHVQFRLQQLQEQRTALANEESKLLNELIALTQIK